MSYNETLHPTSIRYSFIHQFLEIRLVDQTTDRTLVMAISTVGGRTSAHKLSLTLKQR